MEGRASFTKTTVFMLTTSSLPLIKQRLWLLVSAWHSQGHSEGRPGCPRHLREWTLALFLKSTSSQGTVVSDIQCCQCSVTLLPGF